MVYSTVNIISNWIFAKSQSNLNFMFKLKYIRLMGENMNTIVFIVDHFVAYFFPLLVILSILPSLF